MAYISAGRHRYCWRSWTLESVEVLKGPQPVYFGQNATAGAINIRSRRPTETWQSNLDVELANNNTQAVDFGAGGPLGDTWGIRVSGKYDNTDGYLKDVISHENLGAFKNIGGRVILQWEPRRGPRDHFQSRSITNSQGWGNHLSLPHGRANVIRP